MGGGGENDHGNLQSTWEGVMAIKKDIDPLLSGGIFFPYFFLSFSSSSFFLLKIISFLR